MQKSGFLLLIGLLWLVPDSHSQGVVGSLPSLNFNKKLPRDWSLNHKIEFRQVFYDEEWRYDYVRTDLSLLVGKKIGLYASTAGGYQAIWEQAGIRNRFIQQYNLISSAGKVKLGHRFVSDQTFADYRPTVIRLRYRLTTEIPLSGASLDHREYYLKASNEYVNAFEQDDYDLEIRLLGFIGHKLNASSKIELGLDYRTANFITKAPTHHYWIVFNLFQSF